MWEGKDDEEEEQKGNLLESGKCESGDDMK